MRAPRAAVRGAALVERAAGLWSSQSLATSCTCWDDAEIN